MSEEVGCIGQGFVIPLIAKKKWLIHAACGNLSAAHKCQQGRWVDCHKQRAYKRFLFCKSCGRAAPRWCRDFIRLVEGW